MKFSFLKIALLIALSFVFAVSCQNDENLIDESAQTSLVYKSREEVLSLVNNPEILAFFNKSNARIIHDDISKGLFEVIPQDTYTNYTTCLSQPTTSTTYFSFLTITIDRNGIEKAALIHYTPVGSSSPFNLRQFTGKMEIFDLNGKLYSQAIFSNGQLTSNSFSIEQDCVTTVSVDEVMCSHSGQHGVGEECNAPLINDAHFEITISTICHPTYDYGTIPPVFIGGGGGGGGGSSAPPLTQQLYNSLSQPQKDFLDNNPALKTQILVFPQLYPVSSAMVRGIINYGITNGPASVQAFLDNWGNLTSDERNVLSFYPGNNNNSVESYNFLVWAAEYLVEHPDVDIQKFRNWFMMPREGSDVFGYDAQYWENPNLSFPQQSLPTLANFKNAYPTGNGSNLIQTIGGDVAQAFADYPQLVLGYCALKVSYGLNHSGVNIPSIETSPGNPGTVQGSDGKYYFLNAKALNKWMRETFGTNPATTTTPYNANHHYFTGTQGGTNGENFPTLTDGLEGIYSMVSSNPAWASGHADLIEDGVCVFGCHFYDTPPAPIDYIDIWVLQ